MTKLLVFAERMLPSTQTFIPLQLQELKRYMPHYVGLIPAERNLRLHHPSVLLHSDRSFFSRSGRELYRWFGIAPRFHKHLSTLGAKLIHGHFAEGGPAALSLSRRLNLPLILHLRGGAEMMTDAELRGHTFEWPYMIRRHALFQRASLFICVSKFIHERALEAGFPAEKLRVHYTGLDCDRFSPQLSVQGKDPKLVLHIGRLVQYKGCDYLLRAMKQVQQQIPDAHLAIIGDGEFRPALETLNAQLGTGARFLGELPQDQVRSWLEKARIFCSPAVTQKGGMSEAFGNVFSEAQCMGVPVVSFRHGGIPETMVEGITGLLAQERDTEMLATHLHRFLSDDGFWMQARSQGMDWVRRTFSIRTQTDRLEDIYDQVISHFKPESFEQVSIPE